MAGEGAEKLLTVIIPSYDMEGYLGKCIASLSGADGRIAGDVEAIIVNDGSRDGTLEVANGLKAAYAGSVVVIDKANGHYGSCINAALGVARGRYVRVLDADDTFDSAGFAEFLDFLRGCEADLVLSDYACVNDAGEVLVQRFCAGSAAGGILTLLDEANPLQLPAIAYRTEMLREIGYRQTEGVPYSDTEWCIYPMARVRTVAMSGCSVYRYLIGREGQSVGRYYAGFESLEKVLSALLEKAPAYMACAISSRNREYVETRVVEYARFVAEVAIANAPLWRMRRDFDAVCRIVEAASPEFARRFFACRILRAMGGPRLFAMMHRRFRLAFPLAMAYRVRLKIGGGR